MIHITTRSARLTINAEGGAAWYIYDDNGVNLLRSVRVISGSYSRPASVSAFDTLYASAPAAFEVTRYTYYPNNAYGKKGLVHTVTGPMGDNFNYIEYTYYHFGGVHQETKWVNGIAYTTVYEYDSLRRLIKSTDPDGVEVVHDFDNSGNLIRTTVTGSQGVSVTRMLYDALGRIVREIGPDEYNSAFDSNSGYSDISAGTRYSYNAQGLLASKTDPENNATMFEYDDYGNITKETTANSSYTRMTYDRINRPVQEYFMDHTKAAGETLIKQIDYSRSGKNSVVTITEYPGNGRKPVVTVGKYDFAERLTENIAPDGIVTTKAYDKNGALKSVQTSTGGKTTNTLDKWARVTSETTRFDNTGDAVTTYWYDKNGKPVQSSVKNNRSGQNASNWVTEYRNDPWGNVIAVISKNGSSNANYIISKY